MTRPGPSVAGPPTNSMMRAMQAPGGTLADSSASATCGEGGWEGEEGDAVTAISLQQRGCWRT